MTSSKDDCSRGECPKGSKGSSSSSSSSGKLVKSSELPLTGNPYPPKDKIQNEEPSALELSIRSARSSVQPILDPIRNAYTRVSDIASIGVAHSQSAFQDLTENQNNFKKGLLVGASTLLGMLLARKKGFIKKTLFTSSFFAGSAALCYQDAAKDYAKIAWVMAKKNIPTSDSAFNLRLPEQLTKLTNQNKDVDTKVDKSN